MSTGESFPGGELPPDDMGRLFAAIARGFGAQAPAEPSAEDFASIEELDPALLLFECRSVLDWRYKSVKEGLSADNLPMEREVAQLLVVTLIQEESAAAQPDITKVDEYLKTFTILVDPDRDPQGLWRTSIETTGYFIAQMAGSEQGAFLLNAQLQREWVERGWGSEEESGYMIPPETPCLNTVLHLCGIAGIPVDSWIRTYAQDQEHAQALWTTHLTYLRDHEAMGGTSALPLDRVEQEVAQQLDLVSDDWANQVIPHVLDIVQRPDLREGIMVRFMGTVSSPPWTETCLRGVEKLLTVLMWGHDFPEAKRALQIQGLRHMIRQASDQSEVTVSDPCQLDIMVSEGATPQELIDRIDVKVGLALSDEAQEFLTYADMEGHDVLEERDLTLGEYAAYYAGMSNFVAAKELLSAIGQSGLLEEALRECAAKATTHEQLRELRPASHMLGVAPEIDLYFEIMKARIDSDYDLLKNLALLLARQPISNPDLEAKHPGLQPLAFSLTPEKKGEYILDLHTMVSKQDRKVGVGLARDLLAALDQQPELDQDSEVMYELSSFLIEEGDTEESRRMYDAFAEGSGEENLRDLLHLVSIMRGKRSLLNELLDVTAPPNAGNT